MEWVSLRSPEGEVREVEAKAEKLTPYLAAGWHQVPPPAVSQKTAVSVQEDQQLG